MAIAEITAALGSLKAAMDIGKAINQAGNAIEVASLRLQLAELMGALADAKMSVIEAGESAARREAEISRLENALQKSATLKKSLDAYYEIDSKGRAAGDPYCMYCWEQEGRLCHLASPSGPGGSSTCPRCKNVYSQRHTRKLVWEK